MSVWHTPGESGGSPVVFPYFFSVVSSCLVVHINANMVCIYKFEISSSISEQHAQWFNRVYTINSYKVCPLQNYPIALILWSPPVPLRPLEGLPFWHFRDLSFLCINNSSPVYSTAFQYSIVKIKFNSCKLCSVPPSQFHFINQVD